MTVLIREYITKGGDKRYFYRLYLGIDPHTGKKVQTTRRGFKSKPEAKSDANRLICEYQLKDAKKTSTMRYKDLYELWLESYKLTVRESTFVKTKQIFEDHILPVLGEKQLSKIYSIECQKLYNNLVTRFDSGRLMYNYAKKCYQYALVPLRVVTENSFEFIEKTARKKTEKKTEKAFLEIEEMQELLELIKRDTENPLWHVFFSLLAHTGLRKSEALALTWNDISFREKTLTVNKALTRGEGYKQILDQPKTYDSYRTILLSDDLLDLLREWKRSQGKVTPIESLNLMFPNSVGEHIQNTAPDKPLERVISKNGFKKITPHGFRHSHCCHLFDAGISIKEVMDRLGHKDMKVTMEIYNHVTQFRKNDALSKYEQYLKSGSKVGQ